MYKRLLTTSLSRFEFDYFCTLCGYVPRTGDIMFFTNGSGNCPMCGTCFSDFATDRFKSCSIDFNYVPNQNYPTIEYDPGELI